MRKLILAATLVTTCALGSSVAFAQFSGPSSAGGFIDKNAPAVNTTGQVISVKDAITLRDDSKVVLEGKIVEQVGKEKYRFKDASGEVIVEIDNDDWKGIQVTPQDTVLIYGEVDHHRHRPTDIDVDHIMLKP
ncbi:NirD/YgiW/YdeI family stress tolerance protein [Ignatzschineria larvae DSM 13226]|uniref:NirD/YgiW/YdeI family stress tolerance protein n=1 Tax=Ignatzschineria larvae DSM 13226 TaxID=1111732 RepID=A0ABZ3C157_9GAMM|nr:NirD/YgiW/YdeI family stress tolerance protein [Ignatzschineria larvae]